MAAVQPPFFIMEINVLKNILVILVGLITLSGCGHQKAVESSNDNSTNNNKIVLLDKKGNEIVSILEQKKLAEVLAIIEARQPMTEKIMPIFEHQLVIQQPDGQEQWLYSKHGYLKANDSDNSQIYKIKAIKELSKLLLNK